MFLNITKENNNIHHAYCILGNSTDVVSELEKFLKKELNFSIINNPDFWYGEYDVMKIKDGREIIDLHQNRPTTGDKKIFVVSANFITEDAQNSMLKLFEEPRGDTHFFLILPTLDNIIPTLKSRLMVIETVISSSKNDDLKINDFLKMIVGKRMNIVKEIYESMKDEEKSKIEIIKFINSIEKEVKNKIPVSKITNDNIKIFENLEKVRVYAGEQSPSLKMLLEHIALTLPVFKD